MDSSLSSHPSVRSPDFALPEQLDRYWLGNCPFKTHLLNSLTLLLPEVEHHLIRSVKRALPQIQQPLLQQQVRLFSGQEGQHAAQHGKLWQLLRQQGYSIDAHVQQVNQLLAHELEPRCSLGLNLAIGAGLEHLTTLMARLALEEHLLAEAEPSLRDLFEWHAIEEIEHRTVVYDVLQTVTSSYGIRLLGLIISHVLVLGLLNVGVIRLLAQDRKLLDKQVWRAMLQFWLTKDRFLFKALVNAWRYCQPNFHPAQLEPEVRPV